MMTAAAIRDAIQGGKVLHRFAPLGAVEVGADDCEVTVCTSSLALDDDIWVMEGVDLSRFEAHPVVLRDHDMTQPVARASNLAVAPKRITARATFAPIGISPKADETRGLVKSGIITGVSAGIIPLESEPLNPRNPRGGQRITRSILVEFSFVSVPSDVASGVTARARGEKTLKRNWMVGAARNMPIVDAEGWDEAAAALAIFAHAGGDDFDPAEVRRGFLFYDAENPTARDAYQCPIAVVKDGQLAASRTALRGVFMTPEGMSDDMAINGRDLLDAYRKKAGIGHEGAARAAPPKTPRRRGAKSKVVFTRGLYQLANLLYLFEELGWHVDMAKYEAAIEGDGSVVPGMLAAILHDLGDAILAMTTEEMAEALAGHDVEPELEDADIESDDRALVLAGPTAAVRSFRLGCVLAKQRGGKKLSKDTVRCLRAAQDKHAEAITLHRSAIATHKEAMGAVDDLLDDADPEPATDDDADQASRARRARAHQLKAKAANLPA